MFKNWSFGEKSPNQKNSTDQTLQVIFIITFSFISLTTLAVHPFIHLHPPLSISLHFIHWNEFSSISIHCKITPPHLLDVNALYLPIWFLENVILTIGRKTVSDTKRSHIILFFLVKSSILFAGDKTVKVARKAGEGGVTWDSAQAGKSFMQARGVGISLVGTAIPQTVLHLLRSEVWKYKNKNKLKMTKYKCKIQNCWKNWKGKIYASGRKSRLQSLLSKTFTKIWNVRR